MTCFKVDKKELQFTNLHLISFRGELEYLTNHGRKAVGSGHYLRSVTGLLVFTSGLKVEKINQRLDDFLGGYLSYLLYLYA